MQLCPNEIVWLIDNIWKLTGKDEVTGIEHRILGTAIALGESGGMTDVIARSSSGVNIGNRDLGLWQISNRWNGNKIQSGQWRDPTFNSLIARSVYDEFVKSKGNGWLAWQVYISRSFEQWLPDARIGAQFPWEVNSAV